ncbi:uncharacterized protein LOC130930473 [Corythoichthys intestinalis]|uniref:uncharacterized protein LOC130930473 n=1 Tax=Corythoichthys intestinalis TaxID=161448 RepID=UPI0025A5577D|nr:uncharacterized protein LOC130930473 [Corythoichthys intestinalis]
MGTYGRPLLLFVQLLQLLLLLAASPRTHAAILERVPIQPPPPPAPVREWPQSRFGKSYHNFWIRPSATNVLGAKGPSQDSHLPSPPVRPPTLPPPPGLLPGPPSLPNLRNISPLLSLPAPPPPPPPPPPHMVRCFGKR